MNDIGFGIFCFGDDHYYKGAKEKMDKIISNGFRCYILTENPNYFYGEYNNEYILPYNRSYKSYYDKMLLPPHILQFHDICILIDADTHITDYTFLNQLKTYEIQDGISYVDTLLNHSSKKQYINELDMSRTEWISYKNYAKSLLPTFDENELIWEYFLVINNKGFNQKKFYEYYEKLQIAKEFCDLTMNKKVNGAGEGISITISSKLSGTKCQRDMGLFNIVKDKMISISRQYTPKHLWPEWMN